MHVQHTKDSDFVLRGCTHLKLRILSVGENVAEISGFEFFSRIGGSGAMWNMGQNETSFYFCMKQVLKLVSCKNRGMFHVSCFIT
jgi:hypothetical protein